MMNYPKIHKIILTCLFITAGLLFSGCEMVKKKPDSMVGPETVKKKPEKEEPRKKAKTPDISKLSLEEIHSLPRFKECKALLSRADAVLKKKPLVPVKIKAIKGLPEEISTKDMFHFEPTAEKYPQDESIRTYVCPKDINDVKVTYRLVKGSDYKEWFYYSYHGKLKGIEKRTTTNPKGVIEARFGEPVPDITLQIDKIHITSLKPSSTFSNEDMIFKFDNIVFDDDDHISIQFFNKSKKELAIRKFEIILGPTDFNVDYKDNIMNLAPNQLVRNNNVKITIKKKRWFIDNGNKAARFVVKVLYKADRKIKKLSEEKYIRLKDLGINMK